MGMEIERKFLVADDSWKEQATGSKSIRQAYLSGMGAQVRVRIVDDESAVLTLKSSKTGFVRAEYEYPIPIGDARELLGLRLGQVIEKQRHIVPASHGLEWEIDIFEGANSGLVIAEIELEDPQQDFDRPAWLGAEVTDDPRYYNSNLAGVDKADALPTTLAFRGSRRSPCAAPGRERP